MRQSILKNNSSEAMLKSKLTKKILLATALGLAAGITGTMSESHAETVESVVITATRTPQSALQIPTEVSVVSGEEMASRSASDLASALALIAGVEAPSGGDAGPSSAVPSFWGLHEFDAFLLVVDGIPWGGAFNPGITTLDFTNVRQLEVMKGAAPVMYGATSFVGVVQLLHNPAGQAASQADFAYGTYGSFKGSVSFNLPATDNLKQSLALEAKHLGFADDREVMADQHALYRSLVAIGSDTLRFDLDLSAVQDVPPSPVMRVGNAVTPQNANFNPADAKINENKYHFVLGYTHPVSDGKWETTLSYAYSDLTDIRAFLHPDLSGDADTQNQRRFINDGYFDSHLTQQLNPATQLLFGMDALYGTGRQTSLNGNAAYNVPLNGSVIPPATTSLPVNEVGRLYDRRFFTGQYAQLEWKPDANWNVIGGMRLNETVEHKDTSDLTTAPADLAAESVSKSKVRLSETLGASYRFWARGPESASVYADVRSAFKPAAIDFGPDYTPQILEPETALSYEAGIKGVTLDGQLEYQTELFLMNFSNLVVPTSSGALANAAGEKLKGMELEGRWHITPQFDVVGSASYHDARYTNYAFFNGATAVNIAGNQLSLSSHVIAAAGLLYAPESGLTANAMLKYAGRRYLDEENTAAVGGYTNIDATVAYSWDKYRIALDGTNLSNKRPPVTSSEFGSASFYLLNARTVFLHFRTSF